MLQKGHFLRKELSEQEKSLIERLILKNVAGAERVLPFAPKSVSRLPRTARVFYARRSTRKNASAATPANAFAPCFRNLKKTRQSGLAP